MSTALPELPIRRLTRDDLTLCADLSEERGWARDEGGWGLLLTAGTGFGIDDPTGKGLAACYVVTSYGPRLAAIGKLLVATAYERRGLGGRLMRHALEAAGQTQLLLYATAYGQPLYQKLGFIEVGRVERFHGQLRDTAVDAPAGLVTRRAVAEDVPEVVRLDAECFGVDRTSMITRLPAAIDQLWVAEEDGSLVGYAASWPGASSTLAPVIARDSRTARALIASLARSTAGPLRMHIDVRHKELLDWARESGLESAEGTAIMTHGGGDLPGDWRRCFSPLSLATG
ncbi:GNAT family N-acetyltransferase [Streptomyces sp. NPDC048057]|uniref:GNAT family N-acetyltransferase n=1 Tax=Streptomyces sp. NPDC048057 TaxID=3155628 RepID=UPI0033E5ED1B